MNAKPTKESRGLNCRECASVLAHDQRYCLECGTRRGALPAYVAHRLGEIYAQGRPLDTASPPAPEPVPPDRRSLDAWLGAPRAAAAAVIGMLGFGVVVGSLVSESVASPQAVVVAVSPHHLGAAAAGAAGGGDLGSGAAGSSGGTRTITVGSTTPAPSAAASSLGGASAASVAGGAPVGGSTAPNSLPPIKHVFLIMLSQEGYSQTFGHTVNDPYLAGTLAAQGELLPNYYAVAGGPLANEIALVSGQGPTPETVDDCPTYKDIVPGTPDLTGQVLGSGCVYPKSTQTLAGELTSAHLTWKAYVQTPKGGKPGQLEACRHPKLGDPDTTPSVQDPVATWRNPFLYFHAPMAKQSCPAYDAPLAELAKDLKKKAKTPALSYIVPDICHDGDSTLCPNPTPPGMAGAQAFLKSVVPMIKRSAAYKAGGMIAITFDDAPQTGTYADSSSCCNNPTYPNLPPPDTTSSTTTTAGTDGTSPTTPSDLGGGSTNPTGGGGQVGLLLISKYVKPGQPDVIDYFNHFSLLASLEDLFGIKRLGYASDPSLPVFGTSVYTNYAAG